MHYRAPEIMLGLPWGAAVDIWSFGCILVELVTNLCSKATCSKTTSDWVFLRALRTLEPVGPYGVGPFGGRGLGVLSLHL